MTSGGANRFSAAHVAPSTDSIPSSSNNSIPRNLMKQTHYFWWLVIVTLVVAFARFVPKFWELAGTYKWYFVNLWMQVQTLPYAKNLFELFELTGTGDAKILGASTCGQERALAPEPPGENSITYFFCK